MRCTLELPTTQDASHHQGYSIFSRESQPKPSFVTGILGGGSTEGIPWKPLWIDLMGFVKM